MQPLSTLFSLLSSILSLVVCSLPFSLSFPSFFLSLNAAALTLLVPPRHCCCSHSPLPLLRCCIHSLLCHHHRQTPLPLDHVLSSLHVDPIVAALHHLLLGDPTASATICKSSTAATGLSTFHDNLRQQLEIPMMTKRRL